MRSLEILSGREAWGSGDRSVVQNFANGHISLVGRVYSTRADSLGVGLLALQGLVRLVSLDIWQVKSIWQAE
jgi:hypothetical protein